MQTDPRTERSTALADEQTESKTTYANGLLSGFLERQRMKQAAPFVKPGNKVLDLACNEGALLAYLPRDIDYTGVDISARSVARARTTFSHQNFLVADLVDDPARWLNNRQFDIILMLAFLEHVQEPAQVVSAYVRYLAPQGLLIATTPSPHGRTLHDWGAKVRLFSRNAAQEHHTFLDRELLTEIARQAHVKLAFYRRFLFGFNQIACFTP